MTTPANLPSQIGIPSGAPTDIISIGNFLVQFSQSVNGWVARAANAVNWLLGAQTGRASAVFSTSGLGFTTTSATYVSTGVALHITPQYSGRVLINGFIQLDNATGGDNTAQLWYGTGTAPAASAGMTGTNITAPAFTFNDVTANNIASPISGFVSGLALGTKYWFTPGIRTGSGTLAPNVVYLAVVEI